MKEFFSDQVCHEDLARGYDEHARNVLDKFYEKLSSEGCKFLVRWTNILNTDVDSKLYNPLGSTGAFFARESDVEETTPKEEVTKQLMQDLSAYVQKFKRKAT